MTQAKSKSSRSRSNGGNSDGASGAKIKDSDGRYLAPDGGVIDAPVLPEFEQRLADAHTRADDDDIADIQAEYNDARDEHVRKLHRRHQQRKRGDN